MCSLDSFSSHFQVDQCGNSFVVCGLALMERSHLLHEQHVGQFRLRRLVTVSLFGVAFHNRPAIADG